VEALEARLCLAAETILINFQADGAITPTRYLPDTGLVFSVQNGQLYGWSSDHTDVARDREINPDQRLDTLLHFHEFQSWEIQLANGSYDVTVSIGDAEFGSLHTLNVEGVNLWNSVPLNGGEFLTTQTTVSVIDGRLTLDQGNALDKATRINYIQIVNVPAVPNGAPLAPSIIEPIPNSLDVNPTDVHMEAGGYLDPDEGDAHYSTDWEIWTATGERVWQTLGIRGVERRHTHLADGVFENSHAGRTELFGEADFLLRVRFRDAVGSVSDYAQRGFRTGALSTIYPLEIQDIVNLPTPAWEFTTGADVVLPAFDSQASSLAIDTSEGNLLTITATDGTQNNVDNPSPLADHNPIRITVTAGDTGLVLGPSSATVNDETLIERTIYLPGFTMVANSTIVLWVDAAGSTYYGDLGQTEPDFSNLARQSEISVPFVASRPGYVVELVAGDFQLPVNVAFVPNPTTNPDDPLLYVTELYGTVKVMTNSGVVSEYATGLLNFNPTGNFPGSGEQGVAGIVVDPANGDVIITRVTSDIPFDDFSPHHPQVVRLSSNDGGLTAANETILLDMPGESQGQSHQISNISIGPDGKLYVHNGDGFVTATGQWLDSFRGKVLRMDMDGSAPSDNPFYNAGDGINARDYVFAYGLRNPFGGAWRASDGQHYQVENGPSVDRFARAEEGVNYGWNGTDASMQVRAIYNWDPAHAPVNITFVEPATFSGSQFPPEVMDLAFVAESGPTYANGPQERGKRIVTFDVDQDGNLVSGPDSFVEYVGTGRASVVGLTAGPDGLYFTDFYRDEGAASPIDSGSRLLRVRYVDPLPGDFTGDGVYDCSDIDLLVGQIAAQTNGSLFDLTGDGLVDVADRDFWLSVAGQANLGAGRSYQLGDANLDGTVDGQDFLIWNNNKFTDSNGWCGADFTADGTTDGADFLKWNNNKFQSAIAPPQKPLIKLHGEHRTATPFQATDEPEERIAVQSPTRPASTPAAIRSSLSHHQCRNALRSKLQQVAVNRSGESLVFPEPNQLPAGMDFRNLL
jgi:glucose/arabinose dehydrogenase